MSTLSVNPHILLSPVADGYIAYDTQANRLHKLNPTAALLVELCDGSKTIDEIFALAAPLLPPDSESAVRQWLAEATDANLLVEHDASVRDDKRGMSSEDLANLASRLRDEGKVQAAYLCQQRAAELDPTDAQQQRDFGELAHIVGKRESAREAYERYLSIVPDDAEIQHLLTSLRDEAAPARVPNECVRQLYSRFSEFYESNMCDELGYEGPDHLRNVIDQAINGRRELSILDLGCGTGLAGEAVSDLATRIVGVDLSAEMIDQSQQRKIYDELHVAEVTDWLNESNQQFDLIIACDTMIYFGDLTQILAPASRLLNVGGTIAFSVEEAESGTYCLTDNGRYQHHPDHIFAAAEATGMHVSAQEESFLRMEYGEEVTGLYSCLQFAENVVSGNPKRQ